MAKIDAYPLGATGARKEGLMASTIDTFASDRAAYYQAFDASVEVCRSYKGSGLWDAALWLRAEAGAEAREALAEGDYGRAEVAFRGYLAKVAAM